MPNGHQPQSQPRRKSPESRMPGNLARPVRRGAVRKRTRELRAPRRTAYPTLAISTVPTLVIIADDRTMTSVRDPASVMTAGAAILARELSPAGFTSQLTGHGPGSGGDFATARFTRGDQYLEIH